MIGIDTAIRTAARTSPTRMRNGAGPRQPLDADRCQRGHSQGDPQVEPHRLARAAQDRDVMGVVVQEGELAQHEDRAYADQDHPEARPSVPARRVRPRRRPPGRWRSAPCRRSSRDRGRSRPASRCRGRGCRRPRGSTRVGSSSGCHEAKTRSLQLRPPARGERSSSSFDGIHCTAETRTPTTDQDRRRAEGADARGARPSSVAAR